MYLNRRAFLYNCTLTEVKINKYIYKKYFNLQYTLTSKMANMLTTYHQLKSFPLINYILLISFHAYQDTPGNVLNGNLHTVQIILAIISGDLKKITVIHSQ